MPRGSARKLEKRPFIYKLTSRLTSPSDFLSSFILKLLINQKTKLIDDSKTPSFITHHRQFNLQIRSCLRCWGRKGCWEEGTRGYATVSVLALYFQGGAQGL